MSGHICQMDRGQISWVTSASYDISVFHVVLHRLARYYLGISEMIE